MRVARIFLTSCQKLTCSAGAACGGVPEARLRSRPPEDLTHRPPQGHGLPQGAEEYLSGCLGLGSLGWLVAPAERGGVYSAAVAAEGVGVWGRDGWLWDPLGPWRVADCCGR